MDSTMKQQGLTEGECYQNISKGKPSCQKVLDEIPKFISALQDAFDDSHPKCKDFIKKNGLNKKTYNQFYPQMMRFLVHNYLEQEGVKNQLVDVNDAPIEENNVNENGKTEKKIWDPSVLPNNGIAGEYKDYNYRVLKALKYKMTINNNLEEVREIIDLLPPPGSTDINNPRCKFFCQSHLKGYQKHLIAPEKPKKPLLKHNIIIVWDVNQNNFIKLYLAIPKWGNGRQVKVYDMVAIKHPAETITTEKHDDIKNNIAENIVNKSSEFDINDKSESSVRQPDKASSGTTGDNTN
jgi:hypothetical protein